MNRREDTLRVCVATCTRKRPQMLGHLLGSWAKQTLPDNCSVVFLVVENDSSEVSRDVVEQFRTKLQHAELQYVLEPELGIPCARNRAAREALTMDADVLIFIDDDETADETWLVTFVDGYRNSTALLMGAPVRARLPDEPLTWLQRSMFHNLTQRVPKQLSRRPADKPQCIGTGNWLGDTHLFRTHDIWFDERLRFTGGSDYAFWSRVQDLGLECGYVREAVAYETQPASRLSFRYQYGLSRDRSNFHFRRKLAKNPLKVTSLIFSLPMKSLKALLLAVGVPLTGGRTLLELAHKLGWISGRLGVAFGRTSALYEEVTGD